MKGIDHLVLAGHDLEAMRARYQALGFTLTPHGRHPFGTANSLVQFESRCFLELLAVAAPGEVPEASDGIFSFAAFNRDYLRRGEGFSMLVLDSGDADADLVRYREAGIAGYAPFRFSRKARQPDGSEPEVGFSLAFTTTPLAPDAGFFCCQQHAPQYFWKEPYQRHPNTARSIGAAIVTAADPEAVSKFLGDFSGLTAEPARRGFAIATGRGLLRAMTPQDFFAEYRMTPPAHARGAALAGYAITVDDLDAVRVHAAKAGVPLVGRNGRLIVPPEFAFGAMLAFERAA